MGLYMYLEGGWGGGLVAIKRNNVKEESKITF